MVFSQADPVIFEPEKISDGGIFSLIVSPDSKTALWVKRHDKNGVMESREPPRNLVEVYYSSFFSGSGNWKDIDPMFRSEGSVILFNLVVR